MKSLIIIKKFIILSLTSLLFTSCNEDISRCFAIDDKKNNSDCTCKNKDSNYEIIDNIEGIDTYTKSEVEYNYPIEKETDLSYNLNYYCKKEEANSEISQIGIELIKYVFNSDKYDFIYIPVNGGGPSPYNFIVEYNTNNEKKKLRLSIGNLLSLQLFVPGCIKSNKHLYLYPGIQSESIDENTINKIKNFIELTKNYLEDKEANIIEF